MWKANKAKEGGKIRSCSYSRFGINPRSTITEVCLEYRYNYLIRNNTDSVVLGQPLPEEWISSSTLEEGDNVLKHKGAAKAFISKEWFESQYQDLSRTEQIQVSANFRIDYKKPIEITDLGKGNAISHISQMVIKSLKRQILQLRDENTKILSKMAEKEGGNPADKEKDGERTHYPDNRQDSS
ncbi:UNVERIFIED_CONTAM: hypothetical protein Scaly_2604400 [Sesamum calycinum]|uniref:Uncharacterized protein n=1 Tax=Sesamum calycinum TaxID=2727403 RepID=A0AAW2JCH4_9LAMI